MIVDEQKEGWGSFVTVVQGISGTVIELGWVSGQFLSRGSRAFLQDLCPAV